MNLREKFIQRLNEAAGCPKLKVTPEMEEEIKRFVSDEKLLRGGGLSNATLDRAAHGFSEEDIKTIMPEKLSVRWKEDLVNVKHEIMYKKISNKEYANGVDLSEPIMVSYRDLGKGPKFYIEDGHHRYWAAKILGKPLNVDLDIVMNPIKVLSKGLGYDDYHRCLYKQITKT